MHATRQYEVLPTTFICQNDLFQRVVSFSTIKTGGNFQLHLAPTPPIAILGGENESFGTPSDVMPFLFWKSILLIEMSIFDKPFDVAAQLFRRQRRRRPERLSARRARIDDEESSNRVYSFTKSTRLIEFYKYQS